MTDSSAKLTTTQQNNQPRVFSSLISGVEYIGERIPSGSEALMIAFFDVIVQKFAGPIFRPRTPVQKEVFRDTGKLIAATGLIYFNHTHGSTGISYGSGDIAGGMLKVSIKGALIGSSILLGFDEKVADSVSTASNFIAEPFARACVVTNQKLHKAKLSDTGLMNFTKHFFENVDAHLLTGAVASSMPKKTAATIITTAMTQTGLDPAMYVKENAIRWEAGILKRFGIETVVPDAFAAHGVHEVTKSTHRMLGELIASSTYFSDSTGHSAKAYGFKALVYGSEFVIQVLAATASTIMITPFVRTIQDKVFEKTEQFTKDMSGSLEAAHNWLGENPIFALFLAGTLQAATTHLPSHGYGLKQVVLIDAGIIAAGSFAQQVLNEYLEFGVDGIVDDLHHAYDQLITDVQNLGCNYLGLCGTTDTAAGGEL